MEDSSSSVIANTTYRIKLVMKETGLSQAELARRIGVAQQTVQKWAHGISSPTTTNMDKLSDVTGRPPYWFMLPPDEGDQVVTPDSMKIGPLQRDLLKTFSAFPKEDQELMLKEMKDKKETMDKTVARWLEAQKSHRA
ncbi:helix-turn-helix domain-containing protein [Enterobacter cloacae complex sp. ESBL7]|uniref:helix-turn-helix domain-containing protein n=1 Tax=Enterobacter cloacae complex sp. ESBL7 TaxID=3163325 RepID=UPI00356286BB